MYLSPPPPAPPLLDSMIQLTQDADPAVRAAASFCVRLNAVPNTGQQGRRRTRQKQAVKAHGARRVQGVGRELAAFFGARSESIKHPKPREQKDPLPKTTTTPRYKFPISWATLSISYTCHDGHVSNIVLMFTHLVVIISLVLHRHILHQNFR